MLAILAQDLSKTPDIGVLQERPKLRTRIANTNCEDLIATDVAPTKQTKAGAAQ